MFRIESLHLTSNRQNGSNHDLNPNCDWDLPITVEHALAVPMTVPCTLQIWCSLVHPTLRTQRWDISPKNEPVKFAQSS